MNKVKKYLLGQADQSTSWIGAIGIVAEILLHNSPSTLMLVLFGAMVALPEARFSDLFKVWTAKLREMDTK